MKNYHELESKFQAKQKDLLLVKEELQDNLEQFNIWQSEYEFASAQLTFSEDFEEEDEAEEIIAESEIQMAHYEEEIIRLEESQEILEKEIKSIKKEIEKDIYKRT